MNVVTLIYIFMFLCVVVAVLSIRYAVRKVKSLDIERPDLIRVQEGKHGR